jgi:signal transduction histidine kinase/CheY-like chemotaxis protein
MKIGFRSLSIKHKLLLSVFFIFLVTFLSLAIFIFNYSQKELLGRANNEVKVLAGVVSENIAGAVAFNDVNTIIQQLSSLKTIKELEYVEVEDSSGNILGLYSRVDENNLDALLYKVRISQNKEIFDFPNNVVYVNKIKYNDNILGRIIMVFTKKYFYKKFLYFIFYEFLIFFGVFLLAFIVVFILLSFITKPVNELISTMNTVIDNNDFTIRLESQTKDEFGALIDVFNRLLDHIEVQNKILVEAQQKALHHAKVKEHFLAHMSHEIRTPLNAIYGFSVLLEETRLDKNQKLYLHYIKSSIENLQVIINDILDFSKIEAGKLKIVKRVFDLYDFLDELKQLFLPKAQKKDINFIIDIDRDLPRYVKGDRIRLNQILINLIGNAIKFTSTGYVKLLIKVIEKKSSSVRLKFKVIDTGIGIEEHRLNEIFNEFEQANSEISVKYGGTGLGLSITKRLVELQGGKIYVESVYKKGSTFVFELEYELPTEKELKLFEGEQEISGSRVEETEQVKAKILIVEDNKINQLLLKKILTKLGHEVKTANNGKEAISAVEQEDFDLIFMDIHMPEMNGYEATRYIKTKLEKEDKRNIPVVALTAAVTEEERQNAKDAGMIGFIPKPFKEQEIANIISKFVKKS